MARIELHGPEHAKHFLAPHRRVGERLRHQPRNEPCRRRHHRHSVAPSARPSPPESYRPGCPRGGQPPVRGVMGCTPVPAVPVSIGPAPSGGPPHG
ncbi:hypothetical protein KCH_72650 [Kitasatospora cheerisanensis KCTC 2395]|uniref:Uncharacterized protein n=1 Tax=Kitasatospora cheerisanensis KCTC 2395 TaxID=1348663 RepID=A0A066YIC1_9ACTN|nr:hypothetical protein KCH_72650 [Kitasatospora cheerisanensis KCTC 2395]